MAELKHNKNLLFSIGITFFYAVITLVCVFHHEIWSDEAQVWMLCKHLNLVELFKHLVNEGHPSLFYLLTMPFAKFSDNIIFQQLICWLCSVASIFLIWNYSKFNNLTKTILTFSSPFLFHFSVIARNYSLVPILICILAILQTKTKEHPILYAIALALMANTHAIMFPFSFLLGAYFLYKYFDEIKNKNKSFIVSILIMTFGFLALVVQLVGTTQSNVAITFEYFSGIDAFVRVVMLSIFNSFDEYFIKSNATYFNLYSILMFVFMVVAQILSVVILFKKDKKLFFLLTLSIGAQIAIYTFTYAFHIFATRVYCGFMIVLFCYWVFLDKNKENKIDVKWANIVISLLFGLTLINGVKNYYGDIVFDYTPSKRMATFIKNNIDPKTSLIFSDSPGYAITTAFYLEPTHNVYWSVNSKPLKYVVWKSHLLFDEERWTSYFEFLSDKEKGKELYALVNYNPFLEKTATIFSSNKFELIYVTSPSIFPSEMFRIYKFKK